MLAQKGGSHLEVTRGMSENKTKAGNFELQAAVAYWFALPISNQIHLRLFLCEFEGLGKPCPRESYDIYCCVLEKFTAKATMDEAGASLAWIAAWSSRSSLESSGRKEESCGYYQICNPQFELVFGGVHLFDDWPHSSPDAVEFRVPPGIY